MENINLKNGSFQLPQAIESENVVLGTLMNERNAYAEIADILTTDCFYLEENQRIFTAITSICNRGVLPDMITVSQELGKTGEPMYYELSVLAGSTSAQVYHHALVVKEQYIRRQVIHLAHTTAADAYSTATDIDEVINSLFETIKSVYNTSNSGVIHLSDAVKRMRENILANMKQVNKISGSRTGFSELDKRSGGLQPTDMIIIAGESSMGKTSFALSIANNIATSGDEIAIYSLEMSSVQLAARITSMNTGVPANEILYSKLTQEQMERVEIGVNRLCNTGIYIDERSTSNIDTIIASIRNMVAKYNIKGAVIDYLQIVNINEGGSNEETKLGIASRRLKNLAKDLGIWIIALSQLNRNDANPYPTLGRLRGSGQIGEAADMVVFVYRPEYYNGSKSYPDEYADVSTFNTALIDVAKGRNIGTFRFITMFDKPTTHFTEAVDLDKLDKINNPQIVAAPF